VAIPRPLIVKIDPIHHRKDALADMLIEAGFQVARASSIKEGIKLARRCKPNLIVTVDNSKAGVDAVKWLELQHSDSEVGLAMTPLLILAEFHRSERLHIHELPDRVKVLLKSVPPHELLAAIRQTLAVWSF
jgi:DNA-binding response OmpR family regulator